ncbi:unnamed protein product [Adineta ricciae]|uniref:Uncharacterized protein n=1 Tax=Adineta ricciae TaxID=249248 RepID=A0A815FUB9_ADIRI|nr:unnamed protein product [Adineta ricciae]
MNQTSTMNNDDSQVNNLQSTDNDDIQIRSFPQQTVLYVKIRTTKRKWLILTMFIIILIFAITVLVPTIIVIRNKKNVTKMSTEETSITIKTTTRPKIGKVFCQQK